MNKVLLVLKNEMITLLSRRSFWLTALGLPIFGALVFALVGAVNRSTSASQGVAQVLNGPTTVQVEGYVDPGGIIKQIPPDVPAGRFIKYPDEAAARKALAGRRNLGLLPRFSGLSPDRQAHQYPPRFQPAGGQRGPVLYVHLAAASEPGGWK